MAEPDPISRCSCFDFTFPALKCISILPPLFPLPPLPVAGVHSAMKCTHLINPALFFSSNLYSDLLCQTYIQIFSFV